MKSFYTDPAVRQRLTEFLGGDTLEHATAVYVVRSDGCPFDPRTIHLPGELNWFLDRDLDIARSLADSDSLLLHLDIEYVNFDSSTAAYVDAARAFELQQPTVHAIEALLLGWGIRPIHLITGQGHHFVWRILRNSDLARQLEALGPAPELAKRCEERVPPILRNRITFGMQNAFSAVGLLMEYVAHRVKEEAVRHSQIPIEITAVHVGPATTEQREIVSIDISEYGDPLQTRMVRMPFTNYLKPNLAKVVGDLGLEGQTPALRAIPLHEMDVQGALKVRVIEEDVRELASRACVRIPEQGAGTSKLLEEYLASRLRHFHEFFYSSQHDPEEVWAETYAQTPVASFPACVRSVLEQPNDLLLKPAGMQLVSRFLLAEGWHPRHIAGYVRSIFEDPVHSWSAGWDDYEAGTRADFYVRLFTGQYETGLDHLDDFNCVSTQEKGFFWHPPDQVCDLEPYRQKLLHRQCR